MIKLVICLLFGVALAAVMLQLRQQYLNLDYQTSELHDKIESRQADLWSEQLLIAEATAPNAIAAKVRQDRVLLLPASHPEIKNWMDPPLAPTAQAE